LLILGGFSLYLGENRISLIYDYIYIRKKEAIVKVYLTDIEYIISRGNYCSIYAKQEFRIKSSLIKLLQKLPSQQFIKIHQRYVINTDLIDQIDLQGCYIFIKKHQLPIGPKYKKEVMLRIQDHTL